MLGAVLNTHQQWLCRHLADLGYVVTRQVAVADTAEMIRQAVAEALGRADAVITTGGLGPTSDDLTREVIATMFGRVLREDGAVLAAIEKFFAARQRPMPERTRVQALVPDGARVLPNAQGTAPGLVMEVASRLWGGGERPGLLIMLPGPPRELYPMFSAQVAPLLREKFPLAEGFVCQTLHTVGWGESMIEEKVGSPLQPLIDQGLELGYCARSGEVDVRLLARGPEAERLVSQSAQMVRAAVGMSIFSEGAETLEAVVVRLLSERQKTVAWAESCTGGYISHRLTNVPGASAVLRCSWVTYCNDSKMGLLGVRSETLAEHGAVSDAVACEMAEGARSRSGADFGVAVTGIAGPSGGTAEKPVGTVHIALAAEGSTHAVRFLNPYDRETFKHVTSRQALDLMRRALAAA